MIGYPEDQQMARGIRRQASGHGSGHCVARQQGSGAAPSRLHGSSCRVHPSQKPRGVRTKFGRADQVHCSLFGKYIMSNAAAQKKYIYYLF